MDSFEMFCLRSDFAGWESIAPFIQMICTAPDFVVFIIRLVFTWMMCLAKSIVLCHNFFNKELEEWKTITVAGRSVKLVFAITTNSFALKEDYLAILAECLKGWKITIIATTQEFTGSLGVKFTTNSGYCPKN
jgi:hypothetical protein